MKSLKRRFISVLGVFISLSTLTFMNASSAQDATTHDSESADVASSIDDYKPYQGEAYVDEYVEETKYGTFKHVVEAYPKEIYFGDPIYVASYYVNVSNKEISPFRSNLWFNPNEILFITAAVSSDGIKGKYRWQLDRPFNRPFWSLSPHISGEGALGIDKNNLENLGVCEFPPLNDWEAPFWKALKSKLTPEGTVCSLEIIAQHCAPSGDGDEILRMVRPVIAKIVVKPRPETETALLDQWYEGASKNTRSPDVNNAEIDESLPSGVSDIMISGQAYSPWLFIRFGNRKPCIPNNPTSLAGWRELEASLSPSVMRDEIHFTRLLLEYYSANSSSEIENAKKNICNWLKSIPRAQRLVLSPSPAIDGGRIVMEHNNPLYPKWQELLRAVQDENVETEFDRQY